MKPFYRTIALAAVILLVASACQRGGDTAAPMTLTLLDGAASVVRDGEPVDVSKGEEVPIEVDDLVLMSDGVAQLQLETGRSFELEDAEVLVTGTSSLDLRKGALLAELSRAARIASDTFASFSDKGTFRIDKGVSTRVGIYDGQVTLNDDGAELAVPRFRQVVVVGGILPKAVDPLMIDGSDRWDRRFLQEALELDTRLTNFGRGLEAQLGNLAGLDFFRRVAPPGLDVGFLSSFLDQRRSDILIGVMVAFDSGGLTGMSERFQSALDLWSRGASWGLIAIEFGASGNGLFSLLLDAIGRVGIQVVTGGTGTPSGTPSGDDGGDSGNTPGGSDPSPEPTDPSPSPSPDPVQEVIEETEDTADEVECTIAGLLGSPCE